MTQEGIDQLILITLFAFIVIGLITGTDNIRRIRHTIRRDKKKVSEMIKHPFKLRHAVELFKEIKYQKQPNQEDLEHLINFPTSPVGTHEELQALNLKYQATVRTPTAIEATMTPAQLYDAKCPLWANSYSIAELAYYFKRHPESYGLITYPGENVIEYMDSTVVPNTHMMAHPGLYPHSWNGPSTTSIAHFGTRKEPNRNRHMSLRNRKETE